MARAKRICAKTGCPTVATSSYCTKHQAEAERTRGTREARGYDHAHRQLRKQWAIKVAAGGVPCGRCHEPIHPDEPWDLGHQDNDRTKYNGPEHRDRCNRSAAGRAAHPRPT